MFSSGPVIVKFVELSPAVVSFIRLLMGGVILGAVGLVAGIRWPRQQWVALLLAGVAFGGHQVAFISAVQHTSVAIVTLLVATQPLLVAVVSQPLLGEAVPRRLFLCTVAALIGVAVVLSGSVDHGSHSWSGDLWALANLGVWTAYFVLAKRIRTAGVSTLSFTVAMMWLALLVVAPALLFESPGGLPTSRDWLLIALVALGPGNGHLLLNWAHPRVRAALSSLALTLVPVLSSLWAWLALGEPYTIRHIGGMALVILAVEWGRRSR
jgi:drug/metabolite transporter (DMT)-like permease